jgi:hypothetical protein
MPNSYAGLSATAISDKGLAQLKRKIGPVSRYTTDFSDEFLAPGQTSITSPLFGTAPAARTFTTASTGYTRDDTATTNITVTPDILYNQADVNELVMGGSNVDLEGKIAFAGAESVAKGIFDRLNALVLAANYASNVIATKANFGLDDILLGRSQLVAAGVGLDGMHTCVAADTYVNLLTSTANYPQIQRDPQGTGNVLNVPGVGDVYEIASVAANAQNLYGWTAGSDAFCLVARQPMAPKGFQGEVATSVDSESGLSFQTRIWFQDGLYYIWTGALVGVAVGRGSALVRYITA